METLFEQVNQGKIWPLTGGVHPPTNKEVPSSKPIAQMPIPKMLIIPLKQHIGVAGTLIVKEGENVLKGQALTQPTQNMSLPVHAPTSGQVVKIAEHPIAHASGLKEPCLFIETDGQDNWINREPNPHFTGETPEYLVNKLKMAGISGLGGAGFPAYVKSASLRKINYLIVNATECEPYICADDALIRQNAESIIQGIDIIANLINPEVVLIGIEDDKPEAIKRLQEVTEHRHDIQVRVFPSRYPSGGEKQLIHILTGQQVPSGGLPIDVGILVHNIGTLHAIYKAVICDEPCISRIVTVTGGAVKNQQNVEVLIGTPVKELLDFCQFSPGKNQRVIMGGPMMGFTLGTTDIPIVKISNCILAPKQNELPAPENEMDCIRCSACADACPVTLLPQQLFWYSKAKDYPTAESYNLKDCIECGACAYVCPSEIPLVHYYRQAKAEIKAIAFDKQQAEIAKKRFEARQIRLERDAQERAKKQQEAAEKRKQAMAKSGGKSAVADALARVKAKKAASTATQTQPKDTAAPASEENLTPAQKAVARAKAKKLAQAQSENTTAETSAETASEENLTPAQKAVARAKAKKLAKEQAELAEPTEEPKENLTPAQKAVARAKAKKLAKEQAELAGNNEQAAPIKEPEESAPEEKPLTPAQRAVARAKAKKLAKEQAVLADSQADNSEQAAPIEEPQEKPLTPAQRAVARAKAKKLAKEQAAQEPEKAQNDQQGEQS